MLLSFSRSTNDLMPKHRSILYNIDGFTMRAKAGECLLAPEAVGPCPTIKTCHRCRVTVTQWRGILRYRKAWLGLGITSVPHFYTLCSIVFIEMATSSSLDIELGSNDESPQHLPRPACSTTKNPIKNFSFWWRAGSWDILQNRQNNKRSVETQSSSR